MGQQFSEDYRKGLEIGNRLSNGETCTAKQELSNYVQLLAREEHDVTNRRRREADVMAGVRVGDPKDVHLVLEPVPHYEINWKTAGSNKACR